MKAKKRLLSLLLSLAAGTAMGQTIQYSILEDAPEKAHSSFLAIDVMGIDFDFDLRSSVFYVGASGRKELSDKLAVEGAVRPNLLNLSGKGFGGLLEGGVYLPLIQKRKAKDVPVVLKYDPYAGYDDEGRRVEVTNYIQVPGTYMNGLGVRGGGYLKKCGYEADNFEGTKSSMLLGGVYAGFQKSSKALVRTLIDNKEERVGAGASRIFVDFLFLPLRHISDPVVAATATKDRFWGFRGGLSWYLDPHDGKYKRLGRTVLSMELGSRPYTGFYVNMAWSFAILHW